MRNSQKGQALPLFALFFIVLIAFVGIVIADQTTSVQPLPNYPAATTAGQNVVTTDGFLASTLTLAYFQSDGTTPATSTLNVKYVQATVTSASPTYFMKALGFASLNSSASATVLATEGVQAPCGLCDMGSDGRTFHAVQSVINVSGGDFFINSIDSVHAAQIEVGSTLTTTGHNYVAGAFVCNGGSTCTPAFQAVPVGYAGADPLAATPYPTVANLQTYSGGGSASPGIYNGLTIPANTTLNLTAGTYVFTGNLVFGANSSLTNDAAGVTIFLACSNYPSPCATTSTVTSPCTGTAGEASNTGPGTLGSYIDKTASGRTMNLTPPTAGTYKGMSVFADRANYSCNLIHQGTSSTQAGSWYTLNMPFDGLNNESLTFGQVIVPDFGKIFKSTLTVNMVAGVTYTPAGVSRVTLVK